jgi:hypothetical protein
MQTLKEMGREEGTADPVGEGDEDRIVPRPRGERNWNVELMSTMQGWTTRTWTEKEEELGTLEEIISYIFGCSVVILLTKIIRQSRSKYN